MGSLTPDVRPHGGCVEGLLGVVRHMPRVERAELFSVMGWRPGGGGEEEEEEEAADGKKAAFPNGFVHQWGVECEGRGSRRGLR